jgi:alpha-L-rhamnosidase
MNKIITNKIMMNKIWTAKWIMDKKFYGLTPINVFHKEMEKPTLPEHKPDLKNYHMLVRKKFNIKEMGSNAYLDITADDYYKVYINGEFVGQGPASAYYFHYNYNRYDVSRYLRDGDNIITVHVYYQGLINRVWNSGDYRQGLIGELYMDNDLILCTDSTWKCTQALEFIGNTTFGYETQYVEDIDSRLKEKNWKKLSYDDHNWENAYVNISDDHELVLQSTPNIQIYEIKPSKIEEIDKGHYLIDFGQEITGQFKAEACGEAGQAVEIMCGEELEGDTEKHVRYLMRCNCNYKDTWILSGSKDVLEHYDYKAFRYVEVKASENVLCPESFCAIVRHYPMDEEKCKFQSSDELLNSIWKMCKNGVKYGSQEVYVDCPSREKGQYLGDATVTTHSHLYLSGDLSLFKKCLKDFALSTYICPGVMAVAPGSFMQEIADFSLQWSYQLLNYYKHSGDIEFLREMYPIAEGITTYFKKYQRADGLVQNVKEKWNLVDWPDNLRDKYDFNLSLPVSDGCHNVINAFFCGAVKTVNKIRDILGIEYNDEFSSLRDSYIKAFYNNDVKLFNDSTVSSHNSLHSNMLPLFWGLVPKEAEKSVVELIRKKRLNCGVYNSYFLLKGLANVGEYELIYDLITSQDEHSWANMLKDGATTCFEAWGKDQKWNTSLCHPWASSPISVIIEDIIGLKPAREGWEEILFTPHIPKSLQSIAVAFETIKGTVSMEYKDGYARVTVPEGALIYEA